MHDVVTHELYLNHRLIYALLNVFARYNPTNSYCKEIYYFLAPFIREIGLGDNAKANPVLLQLCGAHGGQLPCGSNPHA